MIEEATKAIQTLGFPIVVTVFVLWRVDRKLDLIVNSLTMICGHLQLFKKDE